MTTKLDTMNHTQRAMFARKLLGKRVFRRNAAIAVTRYTISGGR